MVNYFLDTNVFLRYLTNDIPEQAQALENLLRNAEEGECKLHTSVLSIAEIVWTLESYYEQEREQIRDLILGILSTQGLVVEQSQLIEQAVQLYVHKLSLIHI